MSQIKGLNLGSLGSINPSQMQTLEYYIGVNNSTQLEELLFVGVTMGQDPVIVYCTDQDENTTTRTLANVQGSFSNIRKVTEFVVISLEAE